MSAENMDYKSQLARANDKLCSAYRDLKDAQVEMIFRLAMMAEFRDHSTGRHLVRIADYSAIIAGGLGLGQDEVDLIRHASPMHDVGKIILPDAILRKTGPLTAEERELVKKHPLAGAKIFYNARSTLLKACGEIALTHHERYDGTGYPKGLKGDDIPLYGRIVGLADCFDAYTSSRSYKQAIGFDESVEMVKVRSGTHFDPSVVKAFLDKKESLLRIWQANMDIDDFLFDMGLEFGEFEL